MWAGWGTKFQRDEQEVFVVSSELASPSPSGGGLAARENQWELMVTDISDAAQSDYIHMLTSYINFGARVKQSQLGWNTAALRTIVYLDFPPLITDSLKTSSH